MISCLLGHNQLVLVSNSSQSIIIIIIIKFMRIHENQFITFKTVEDDGDCILVVGGGPWAYKFGKY